MTTPARETEPGLQSGSSNSIRRRGYFGLRRRIASPEYLMHCWAVIAAGGQGLRCAAPGQSAPKQFAPWQGVPLYWHSVRVFARVARLRGIVLVFPAAFLQATHEELLCLAREEGISLPLHVAAGGAARQESVSNGLAALPAVCDTVLVHDAARPFVTPALINRVLDALADGHPGVIPGIPVTDTVKEVDAALQVRTTPDRSTLRAVQTPQGFALPVLRACHAAASGKSATDDASLLERHGHPVLLVEGDPANRKITTPEDLAALAVKTSPEQNMFRIPRVGFGYDVHRYGGSRPLKLGGVPIPTDVTVSAHSDGDVLLHALADAILGCLGAGDIGQHFPDSDAAYDNASSGMLLAEVLRKAVQSNLTLHHADCTVVAQTPKIAPYRERIAKSIASLLHLPPESVNVKATTEERLGFTGEKLGIKAYAVVTASSAAV